MQSHFLDLFCDTETHREHANIDFPPQLLKFSLPTFRSRSFSSCVSEWMEKLFNMKQLNEDNWIITSSESSSAYNDANKAGRILRGISSLQIINFEGFNTIIPYGSHNFCAEVIEILPSLKQL